METKKLANLEKLIEDIKTFIDKTYYIFSNNEDRLKYINEAVIEYENEEANNEYKM